MIRLSHATPTQALIAIIVYVVLPVLVVHAAFAWWEWRAKVRRARVAMEREGEWIAEHEDHTARRGAFR